MNCPVCEAQSDDGLVCPRCIARCVGELHELTWLWGEWETNLSRQNQYGTGNGGRGVETPLPFDANASLVGSEVKMALVNWVRTFELGDQPLTDHPQAICSWLATRPERIRGHGEGHYFVEEVPDMVKRLRRVVDVPPDLMYLGPCNALPVSNEPPPSPNEPPPVQTDTPPSSNRPCKRQRYAPRGVDKYVCPGMPGMKCGAEHDVAARREHLIAQVREQAVTAARCALILASYGQPVKVKTIHNWATPRTGRNGQTYPPKLWRAGVDEQGNWLYRIGDVEQLAKETMLHQAAKAAARGEAGTVLAVRRGA